MTPVRVKMSIIEVRALQREEEKRKVVIHRIEPAGRNYYWVTFTRGGVR